MNTNILNESKSKSNADNFLAKVYMWMFSALAITGAAAWIFATNESLTSLVYYNDPDTGEIGGYTLIGWISAFAPLAFVLIMGIGYRKLSKSAMQILFIIFSAVMGMGLSSIFFMYSIGSIGVCFLVTAGTFLVMSIIGYTTKTDLTKIGSLLMMALIGIIIAMLANWFIQSAMMDYIISIIGVFIFVGLIAYDTQKLKEIGMSAEAGGKMEIMGAMSLYLDFVNLFLFILRLFGGNSD